MAEGSIDPAVLDAGLARLRRAVAERWNRVYDVFRRWDEDGSGSVDRREWVKVVSTLMGEQEMTKEECGLLFDHFDKDGSGALEYKEIYKELRAGAGVELDAKLRDGAAGDISSSVANRYALRTDGPQTHKSRVLYGAPKLEMGEGHDFKQQLSNALVGSWTRVRDLWAEWDEDLSGHVDKKEFFRALCLFGLECTRQDSDRLFESFDEDSSGTIEYHELSRALHMSGGHRVQIDANLRVGAVKFELESKNKHALRRDGPGKVGSNVFSGLVLSHIRAGSGAGAVLAELRNALSANLSRCIDLFREWDADGSGSIDKKELHRALTTLGMGCSVEESNQLFDSLDDDHSGEIEFGELHMKLKRGEATSRALAAGVVPRYCASAGVELAIALSWQSPCLSLSLSLSLSLGWLVPLLCLCAFMPACFCCSVLLLLLLTRHV